MQFNPKNPNVLHIDINSCFATIEQQANPILRGKPVVVVAYNAPNGCILASSVEAKRLGIKTGMSLSQGRSIYPRLISLLPDPNKYRDVHKKLRKLLTDYSLQVIPKSIDEFCLELNHKVSPCDVAQEIKMRIKSEIGEWITVSIGISTNRYLAKIAAGIHKPDGLIIIDKNNYLDIYSKLKLTDLTGIKRANACRLYSVGIFNVLDLYNYPKTILGGYWNLRLQGYEVDIFKSKRQSFSNEVALKINKDQDLSPIIARLFEKASFRARESGFAAGKKIIQISNRKVSVTLCNLSKRQNLQLDFFGQNLKRYNLEKVMDYVNQKWGNFVIGSVRGFMSKDLVKDRISFGH